jgi:hypothetical protein
MLTKREGQHWLAFRLGYLHHIEHVNKWPGLEGRLPEGRGLPAPIPPSVCRVWSLDQPLRPTTTSLTSNCTTAEYKYWRLHNLQLSEIRFVIVDAKSPRKSSSNWSPIEKAPAYQRMTRNPQVHTINMRSIVMALVILCHAMLPSSQFFRFPYHSFSWYFKYY